MYKIMVVDDEVIITAQLERRLTLMGYDVVGRANSGEKSIDMAMRLRPDLILMDIVMPGEVDGIDAAGKIRKEMDIPIIFLTAYADDLYVSRAKEVEPYGYIVKPFQENEVRATIEVALYRKDIERDIMRSMERLQTIVDTLHDAVISLDGAGEIIFWNRRAQHLFGYESDEVMGKKFSSFLSEPAKKCLETILSRGELPDMEKNCQWSEEFRGLRKDGGEFLMNLLPSIQRVRNERFITCVIREQRIPIDIVPLAVNSGRIQDIHGRLFTICSYCGLVRDDNGAWRHLAEYLGKRFGIRFSHGICPICMKTHHPDISELD